MTTTRLDGIRSRLRAVEALDMGDISESDVLGLVSDLTWTLDAIETLKRALQACQRNHHGEMLHSLSVQVEAALALVTAGPATERDFTDDTPPDSNETLGLREGD